MTPSSNTLDANNNSGLDNPAPWQTLPAMLQDCCARYSDQVAIIDGERQIHFAELYTLVNVCAQHLQQRGMKREEPVVIWAQNSWQWIVLAFAVWQTGAVVVPVSSRLKALEVTPLLHRSRSRWLFASADCLGEDLITTLDNEVLARIDHVFALHGDNTASRPFDELLDETSFRENSDKTSSGVVTGNSLCQILFTSGTTGKPKGVMLEGQQLLQAYWDWSDQGGLQAGDRFLVIPPFSHGFGINAGIVACVMRGMTHVVVDFFDPGKTLSLIEQHRISVMSGAPALFVALAAQVEQQANQAQASLRVAYVGAAHVPEDTIRSMKNVLGIDRVINAYGLIEGCVVSMTRADDSIERVSTSVGTAMPNVSVRICADDDNPLPAGESGEIQLHSYGLMRGYFEAEELTRAAITESGWLRTGDIGSIDPQGYIAILGRKKDMYICNGFNVYPAEVEDLLLQSKLVDGCAVIGVDDEKKGESGIAFVVSSSNADTADKDARCEQLTSWCKNKIAAYKVPRAFHFIDALPLNANGKVQKDMLRTQLDALDSKTGS